MSIELVNVSKAFGETQVLRGLSERFAQGEAVCVMGRSGLGKTTLARIVMGLEKPDAGAVRGAKGKRFAAAFQEDRLVERLSAQGNLRFACGAALEGPGELFQSDGLQGRYLQAVIACLCRRAQGPRRIRQVRAAKRHQIRTACRQDGVHMIRLEDVADSDRRQPGLVPDLVGEWRLEHPAIGRARR